MIITQRRSKTVDPKDSLIKFTEQTYKGSQNPQQYIEETLRNFAVQNKINIQCMNFTQFSKVLSVLRLNMKTKQLHQLYLYATYEAQMSLKQVQTKHLTLLNEQTNKINLPSVAKWIHKRLLKNKIQFISNKSNKKNSNSAYIRTLQDQKTDYKKLPIIKTRPTDRFKNQLHKVLNIFGKMEKERQDAGLEPVSLSLDEESIHDQPIKQMHYEGSFFEVNKKLNHLRSEAKMSIQQMILATKENKNLRKKFQQALIRYEKARTEGNQKIGRGASMKAQKRMIDKKKQDILNLAKWRAENNKSEYQLKYF